MLIAALILAPATSAFAATSLDGPVDLGTATPFGVLAYSTVTNTGTTTISGDVGLYPGTSVTGFPPGLITDGVIHATDPVALQAKRDLTTAYNTAAGLTPQKKGLKNLGGQTLVPGVYSGGALSITGALTLSGTAESVWVFQAASTLKASSNSQIILTNGASACNVFWQVGSSATIGTSSQFVGTVMAHKSITAQTTATIEGRLLASTGAVTMDTNVITRPEGCEDATGNTSTSSATITSDKPKPAVEGKPYSDTVKATATGDVTYSITSGKLPTGLKLNATTGKITGTPTTPGTYTFTVTATGDVGPPDTARYSITVAEAGGGSGEITLTAAQQAELAETGAAPTGALIAAGSLGLVGLALFGAARTRRTRRH